MNETLQTERLLLRPITLEDAEALFSVYRDPRAMKFMPTPPHQRPEQTRAELAQEMSLEGACGWAIRLKEFDHPIGFINFLGQTPIPGLGYILHPDYWGQGIVPEACRAALTYGFAHLGYDRVELWINESNFASIRVAQKLGFGLKGRLPMKYNHEKVHHTMLVFGLLAAEEDPADQFFQVEPVLMARNVAETVRFYCDLLGFQISFLYGDPPTHAGVSRGGWSGSRVSIQLSQAPAGQTITPSGSLFISIGSGLDALCQTYRQKGVTIVEQPESKPWGLREFAIRDCNGHLLRFATQG